MQTTFLGQPFDEFGQVANALEEHLNEGSGKNLWIASAWAKRSGLKRLQDTLSRFHEQGGSSVAIIGIDEGGATEQGLRLAVELFDQVNVFHDNSRRTFHPKVYLLDSGRQAYLIVGSNNATAGGLYDNYEAAITCVMDLAIEEDKQLFDSVSNWFKLLLSDAACVTLSSDVIARLISDPRYRVGDENHPERSSPQVSGYQDGVATDTPGQSIFERATSPKKPLSTVPGKLRRRRPSVSAGKNVQETRTGRPVLKTSKFRWYKKMSRADAQQPEGTKTNPTGNLKLTSAGQNIDRETFFRDKLFGNADWAVENRNAGELEKTVVPIEVHIEDERMGEINFYIDHGLYRIANQKNVPTWLHWGPFGKVLRGNDYFGRWVTIENFYDGSYRLRITSENP